MGDNADDVFDKFLKKIAEDLYEEEVYNLGKALGFTLASVTLYNEENMRKVNHMGSWKMLQKWRRGETKAPPKKKLKAALEKANLVRFVDEYLSADDVEQHPRPTPAASTEQGTSSQYQESKMSDNTDVFNQFLKKIAKEIHDDDLDDLGDHLEFTPAQINLFKDENKRTVTTKGTLKMLKMWRDGQTETNQRGNLKAAMEKAGLVRLVHKYFSADEMEQHPRHTTPASMVQGARELTSTATENSQVQLQSDATETLKSPSIFISYQWDKLPETKRLFSRLTGLGYHCWLDIYHQMGGGDQLEHEIAKGVGNAKVVISCVTPKYALSANCRREVSLSDALRKPIIPLLLEKMTWPPEGPMNMPFTELVYINFTKETTQAMFEGEQFEELIKMINKYTQPMIEIMPATEERNVDEHLQTATPKAEGPIDIPSETEEMETVSASRSTPLPQKEFYDIYLLSASKETPHFLQMKKLILRNGWKMTTPFESKLGVPVLESIERAVLNSSHVVYLITKEDCDRKDASHTMTIEMAFQSLTDKGLGGRVIPVFCCDMSFVPLKLRCLTGVNIRDEALEERLTKTIDVTIRKEREEEYRSVSGNQSSIEMTTHTGPSTTASASADGAASSSKASEHVDPGISEMELHDLAEKLGNHTNLKKMAVKLGFLYERWRQYEASNTSKDGRICTEGTHDMLIDWKKNTPQVSQKALLNEALKDAGFAEFADDTDNNAGNDGQLISFGGLSAPPEILARGQRAQQAYVEAAKAGTKKVFRTRLMLVGQERVGKTSLKKTLTGQGFDKNEAITDGVDTTNVCEINVEVAKAGEEMWTIHKKGRGNEDKREDVYSNALADEITKQLIVTPPQDQESLEPSSDTTLIRGLSPEKAEDEYRKALVDEQTERLTVTPTQDQESLEPHSDTTSGKCLDPVEADESVEKDDNIPYQISSRVEKRLKEQVQLKEKGTDGTDSGRVEGVSLSIWDFAGQDIYYTTHQVFLTWRAIYVIVFDLGSLCPDVPPDEMAKGGAESELKCLEFINFWLRSIFAHAVAPSSVINKKTISPPIFIVGTHRGSVKGDGKIDSAFEKIRKSIMNKPFENQVIPKYYAIENSLEDNDEQLIALRRKIKKVAMDEPYMGEEIPLRWLYFEENLAAEENYMSLDQTKELMGQVGITSESDLLPMLTFYHDLGYIVYYGGIEDQKSLLRDMVILNPQWLIDVFKQVITIMDPAERDRIVNDAWTTLEEDGILEDRLIQHMWQGFSDQKDTLVQLMAKFDLICEAPVERIQQEQQYGVDTEVSNEPEKVVKKRYYVPSRLTTHYPPEEKAQIKSSTDFYVDFKGFLPDGLFHRLMTRAVRWMGERDGEPVDLFYRHISLMVDEEHHAILEMLPPSEATIQVAVFQGAVANFDHDGDCHESPVPSAVKEVMDFVERTLDDLIERWARRIKYDVCFLCPMCSKKTPLKHCFKRKSLKSLKCGKHQIRTAAVKSRFGMSEEGVETGNKSPVMPKRSKQLQGASSSQTQQTSHQSTDETPENISGGQEDLDEKLTTVAQKVGRYDEIDNLGKALGFDPEDIKRYVDTNMKTSEVSYMGTLSMLRKWRKKQTKSTECEALKGVLRKAGQIHLADELFGT